MREDKPEGAAPAWLTVTTLEGRTGLRLAGEADLCTALAVRRAVAELRRSFPDHNPGPFHAAVVGRYRVAASVRHLAGRQSLKDGYADESSRSRGEPDETG